MDLREQFDAVDRAAIHGLIESGREEDVRLDFKTVSAADLSSRPDRKNLAIALSGFANSSGGIVIWGVDARTDSEGIDRAVAPREITPIRLFVSKLAEYSPSSASPPVDGVLHKAIATSADAGFAATYVPESERAPHMAKLGEDRYYKRNSSRFYVLEHFDLQDMFGRRQRPALEIGIELRPRLGADLHEELWISLINKGRAVAKHSGLHCNLEQGTKVVGARGSITDVSSVNGGRPAIAYVDSVGVIHPNGIRYSLGHAIILRSNKQAPLAVEGRVFCEHMASVPFAVIVTPDPPVESPAPAI